MTIELGLFDIHQVDPTTGASLAEVYEQRLQLLELADRLGLRYAFTAERHYLPGYRMPAATAWIAAASQRTRMIRLGVLAYTLPLHPPVALAEEIAVLDHLAHGRLEVGFGLGHRPEELVALGINPGEAAQIFQERFAVLTALWEGGVVTLERPTTTVRDVAIFPGPFQQPYPPIWFAGGDPIAAQWAGSRGISLAMGFRRTTDLVETAAAFRTGREQGPSLPEAGRLALMRQVSIAPTDASAMEAMVEDLDRLQRLGSGRPGDLDEARQAAERMVADETFMAGSPETVAVAIRQARDRLGIDIFLANIHAAGVSQERLRRMTHLLAEEVAPRLQV